jgi:hypothetical protein
VFTEPDEAPSLVRKFAQYIWPVFILLIVCGSILGALSYMLHVVRVSLIARCRTRPMKKAPFPLESLNHTITSLGGTPRIGECIKTCKMSTNCAAIFVWRVKLPRKRPPQQHHGYGGQPGPQGPGFGHPRSQPSAQYGGQGPRRRLLHYPGG